MQLLGQLQRRLRLDHLQLILRIVCHHRRWRVAWNAPNAGKRYVVARTGATACLCQWPALKSDGVRRLGCKLVTTACRVDLAACIDICHDPTLAIRVHLLDHHVLNNEHSITLEDLSSSCGVSMAELVRCEITEDGWRCRRHLEPDYHGRVSVQCLAAAPVHAVWQVIFNDNSMEALGFDPFGLDRLHDTHEITFSQEYHVQEW
mmetsp:Transcript_38004/g.62850  ORF Transcript_38004/g.62850 Transcript_38004/m.62850 type:complete len:204 (-) Transcript_38004:114-725(-)